MGALGTLPLEQVGLVALVGSHAYGMATEHSDRDYRGFYVPDATGILGLREPEPQYDRKDPDLCIFEIGKFAKLALAANPNIIEILWAQPAMLNPAGERLREIRTAFLSQRARSSYIGYANAQLRRVVKGESFSGDGPRRRVKAVGHLFRLLEQGEHLLRHGDLNLEVSDPERLRSYAAMENEALAEFVERRVAEVIGIESPLPEHPDVATVERAIVDLRREQILLAS